MDEINALPRLTQPAQLIYSERDKRWYCQCRIAGNLCIGVSEDRGAAVADCLFNARRRVAWLEEDEKPLLNSDDC